MSITIDKIKFKRGTTAHLAAWTAIPDQGEPVYDFEANILKIGDGIHTYSELRSIGSGGSGEDRIIFGTHYEFPSIGKADTLYVAKDEGNIYIWEDMCYRVLSVDGREVDGGGASTIYW